MISMVITNSSSIVPDVESYGLVFWGDTLFSCLRIPWTNKWKICGQWYQRTSCQLLMGFCLQPCVSMANSMRLPLLIICEIFSVISVLNLLEDNLIFCFGGKKKKKRKDKLLSVRIWSNGILVRNNEYHTKYFRKAPWYILLPCTFILPSQAQKAITHGESVYISMIIENIFYRYSITFQITYFKEVGRIK